MLVFVSHTSKDVAPLHKSPSLEILLDVVNGVWYWKQTWWNYSMPIDNTQPQWQMLWWVLISFLGNTGKESSWVEHFTWKLRRNCRVGGAHDVVQIPCNAYLLRHRSSTTLIDQHRFPSVKWQYLVLMPNAIWYCSCFLKLQSSQFIQS
jgi:hypothetical protein